MTIYEIMKELQLTNSALQSLLAYNQGLIDCFLSKKNGTIYKIITPTQKTLKPSQKELPLEQ